MITLRNVLENTVNLHTALNISGIKLFKCSWIVYRTYFVVLFIRQN